MPTTEAAPPIAVIGAGFSGTMAAIQLLAALSKGRAVLLCEQAEAFARAPWRPHRSAGRTERRTARRLRGWRSRSRPSVAGR
ncbi:FAD/NAD(P)-binding protein [Methylobacterium nigriterrae]|uniref:FAD/NAD(P)-binding protein n=1 Tax=Methylobacterium nigriterrae TaxID=3127512 RepID=UPI003D663F21